MTGLLGRQGMCVMRLELVSRSQEVWRCSGAVCCGGGSGDGCVGVGDVVVI